MNHLILGLGVDPDEQNYEDLGRERFNTDWAPKFPADLPSGVTDIAGALRAVQPFWAFEQDPNTIAATSALLNKTDQ